MRICVSARVSGRTGRQVHPLPGPASRHRVTGALISNGVSYRGQPDPMSKWHRDTRATTSVPGRPLSRCSRLAVGHLLHSSPDVGQAPTILRAEMTGGITSRRPGPSEQLPNSCRLGSRQCTQGRWPPCRRSSAGVGDVRTPSGEKRHVAASHALELGRLAEPSRAARLVRKGRTSCRCPCRPGLGGSWRPDASIPEVTVQYRYRIMRRGT